MAKAIKMRKKGKITTPGKPFEASNQLKIDNLIKRSIFEFILFNYDTHKEKKLFNLRMVRKIKVDNKTGPYEKSRLII